MRGNGKRSEADRSADLMGWVFTIAGFVGALLTAGVAHYRLYGDAMESAVYVAALFFDVVLVFAMLTGLAISLAIGVALFVVATLCVMFAASAVCGAGINLWRRVHGG